MKVTVLILAAFLLVNSVQSALTITRIPLQYSIATRTRLQRKLSSSYNLEYHSRAVFDHQRLEYFGRQLFDDFFYRADHLYFSLRAQKTNYTVIVEHIRRNVRFVMKNAKILLFVISWYKLVALLFAIYLATLEKASQIKEISLGTSFVVSKLYGKILWAGDNGPGLLKQFFCFLFLIALISGAYPLAFAVLAAAYNQRQLFESIHSKGSEDT